MKASVVITTKNRKEDLAKAIESALNQTAHPEVLILDDGSTDGTSDMVQSRFPRARLVRFDESRGLVVRRNEGAGIAVGDIVFSIDDDAVFSSPQVIEQTLREFDAPRVGAVAIPFIDVNQSDTVKQAAPDHGQIYACYNYIGTAHALRRSLFLELGGYRELIVHQGEEEDYCIRMLQRGYITRCGTADPIHHFESPRRSWVRMDYYGARNKVTYAWNNVPMPSLLMHLVAASLNALTRTFKPDRLWTRSKGVLAAYWLCFSGQGDRRPVSKTIYRLSRKLRCQTEVPLCEIEGLLPAIQVLAAPVRTGSPQNQSPMAKAV